MAVERRRLKTKQKRQTNKQINKQTTNKQTTMKVDILPRLA